MYFIFSSEEDSSCISLRIRSCLDNEGNQSFGRCEINAGNGSEAYDTQACEFDEVDDSLSWWLILIIIISVVLIRI